MSDRSYKQFCPAARALDIIGERWSLLIVRELLFGPKRYTDLQHGLPGVGPKVLSDRLRSLERDGVVARRRLPPPAGSTVYELTDRGAELRGVMAELFRWGTYVIEAPTETDAVRASWWVPVVRAAAHPERLPPDADDVYEFRLGDDVITVVARAGEVTVHEGEVESPDVVVRTDHETFVSIGTGRTSPLDAVESGRLTVEGDEESAERCAALFGSMTAAPAA